MTKVILIDDHAIVRQGLRSILQREDDLEVVAEASTPDEALTMLGHAAADVALLDLKLSSASDAEGLDLCATICEQYPEVSVLVLSTFLDEQLVLQAVRNGAKGYVVKDVDTSGLVRAIRDVSRGESAFDAHSAAAMVRGLNAPVSVQEQRLTDREAEVLRLLARGLSNKDIGATLYISEATAKFHVGNIMRKLGVTRRAEAVYQATKIGAL